MSGEHDDQVLQTTADIDRGEHLVPSHLWQGIREHVLHGTPTGGFLSAVFANDLLNAATGADDVSLANLPDIMRFMHNYAPSRCWGSKAIRDVWRAAGGIAGGAHISETVIALDEARL